MSMEGEEKGVSEKADIATVKEGEEGGGRKEKASEEEDEEDCTTPTGSWNRIPEIKNCPPAPRKRRRSPSPWMLRRRSFTAHELHFFEETRRQEVDSFFQSINSANDFSKLTKRGRSV